MYKIKVIGSASQKVILEVEMQTDEEHLNFLEWLRLKKIPIASSCNGDGVCQKCVINHDHLACMTSAKDLADENDQVAITISYL